MKDSSFNYILTRLTYLKLFYSIKKSEQLNTSIKEWEAWNRREHYTITRVIDLEINYSEEYLVESLNWNSLIHWKTDCYLYRFLAQWCVDMTRWLVKLTCRRQSGQKTNMYQSLAYYVAADFPN